MDVTEMNFMEKMETDILNDNDTITPYDHLLKANLKSLRLDHCNIEEKRSIRKLCLEYCDIFYCEQIPLTFSNQITHKINLTDESPIFTKTYRYPEIHRSEVKSQINKMLEQGIIQDSISPWSSPIWIVPKKLDASGKKNGA